MSNENDELPVLDTFRGDDAALIRNAQALLNMDADGSLVPHGIGGHARGFISAFIVRLNDAQRIRDERDRLHDQYQDLLSELSRAYQERNELRKSLALVQRHAKIAWNRGHTMGIESARQQIEAAVESHKLSDAARLADNARLTEAMIAAEDERDRLRAELETERARIATQVSAILAEHRDKQVDAGLQVNGRAVYEIMRKVRAALAGEKT